MTPPPRDRSRDVRVEDPTNRWVVHAAARALLPLALRLRFSANAVSIGGLALGVLAALCYLRWDRFMFALLGFGLSIAWLICDGLDGMIARATGTASALGRILDGVCDHAVFILIYCAIAGSIGTGEGWAWAIAAGAAHAIQSSLYEAERIRFHRRLSGDPTPVRPRSVNPGVRAYDAVSASLDPASAPFERAFAASADRLAFAAAYGNAAAPALRAMIPLSANTRVIAILLACLSGNPRLFWGFELVPLTLVAIFGILWLRRVEARLSLGVTVPQH
ncbi:MAG: CDP-alcohol phosphatidyltransferase family protein [Sphingomonadaceae bacterium]|nr:CDP-alcohol phosphatidyltransferase family protein [Sphingomonadaceae bacterium]